MKRFILTTLFLGICMAFAEPPESAPGEDTQDQSNLGDVEIEIPMQLEESEAEDLEWTQSDNGIIGQFLQAPSPLDPINPARTMEADFGVPNLSQDTVNGRIMGLHFLKFNF